MVELEYDYVYRGLRIKTVVRTLGDTMYRCGYVGVDKSNPLWGIHYYDKFGDNYLEDLLDVHGGITYTGNMSDDVLWWIGFDCAHYQDSFDYWTRDRVKDETMRLADQIIELSSKNIGQTE